MALTAAYAAAAVILFFMVREMLYGAPVGRVLGDYVMMGTFAGLVLWLYYYVRPHMTVTRTGIIVSLGLLLFKGASGVGPYASVVAQLIFVVAVDALVLRTFYILHAYRSVIKFMGPTGPLRSALVTPPPPAPPRQ